MTRVASVRFGARIKQRRSMERCYRGFLSLCLVTAGLSACGGGDGGSNDSNIAGTGTAYAFVPPVGNSSRVYAETVVDNSNNTINLGYMETVLSLAADGTITEQQQSTTGTGDTVNGTDYSAITETQTYNNFGRETGFTYIESDGSPGSCIYAPYAGGPMPPLTVGQTWQIDYTETCNANPAIHYSQNGTVVDVESVTVPAGTFTALKLQSTVVWTDNNGTTHTQTTTNWLDTASFHSVKTSATIVDTGTPPVDGYAVSRETEFQSSS
jgi:hypothetical protein